MIAEVFLTLIQQNLYSGNMIKNLLLLLFLCLLHFSSQAQLKTERLEAMVDRPYYFCGQPIKLSYALITNEPLETELVYVQILNTNNKIVLQAKSLASSGTGTVQVKIPEDLPAGEYTILAFTNYLRNYDEQGPFSKSIYIYSHLEEPQFDTSNKTESYILHPEGGTLPYNLPSRIAYIKNHNCSDNGIKIIDDQGLEILEKTIDVRVGSFFISPKNGRTYALTHNCSASGLTNLPLPTSTNEGVSMSIKNQTNKIQIIIRANYNIEELVSVKGYFKNIEIFKSDVNLTKKGLILEIDKADLPHDQIQFYLISQETTIAKTLIDLSLLEEPKITLEKEIFTISDSAQVKIEFTGNSNRTVFMKIIPEEWMHYEDLRYDLDLKENYNSIYDLSIFQSSTLELDTIKNEKIAYIKESNNTLKGQIVSTQQIPKSTKLYTLVPNLSLISETDVDSNGFFELPSILQSYNSENISYFLYSDQKIIQNVEIIQVTTPYVKSILEVDNNRIKDELLAEYNALRIKKRISENTIESRNVKSQRLLDINNFISDYDVEYNLDNYTSFASMQEISKELLDGVLLRQTRKGNQLRLFNETNQAMLRDTPMMFIDNMPTKDISKYLEIPPYQIDNIRIIKNDANILRIGALARSGIIIINLKDQYSRNKGFSQLGSFPIGLNEYSDREQLSSSVSPDIRSVLSWSTFKAGTSELKASFKSSDRPGYYRIVVKSVADSGEIGFASKRFKIHFKNERVNN